MPSRLIDRSVPLFLIGLVLMVCALFLEPLARFMGPLEISPHRHIAASNAVSGVLAFFAFMIRLRALVWDEPHFHNHVREHRLGELFLLMGLVLHRPFYIPYRTALEYDANKWAVEYATQHGWWTTLGQSFWWAGCVLMCVPQLAAWAPRTWPYAIAAIIPAIWVVGYQAVDLLAPLIGVTGGR